MNTFHTHVRTSKYLIDYKTTLNISITISIILGAFVIALGSSHQLVGIVLILICLWKGRKCISFFNPYYLLTPSLISYCLFTPLMGSFLLTELTFEGNVLIWGCFIGLILGFDFVKKLSIKQIGYNKYNENFNVILLIGLIPTIASIILVGNPMELEGQDALEAKEKFNLPMVSQLMYFSQAAIVVACKNNNTRQILVAVLINFFVAIISLTKTGLLLSLLFSIFGLYTFKPDIVNNQYFKKIKKLSWFLIPILLLVGFAFNNNTRNEASGGNGLNYAQRENQNIIAGGSNFAENMYLNYLYFCSPWGNLQYNLNKNHRSGYGRNSFAQFAKKMGITIKPVKKMQPAFLNTHSFITDFYLDFGYFGAMLASFILGCIIFYCYRKYGLSSDALLVSFYVLISYATLMLFFSNHFIIGYLLNYYITFGGYYLLMRKKSPQLKSKYQE